MEENLDVERQLKEWKEQMRAERSKRLLQSREGRTELSQAKSAGTTGVGIRTSPRRRSTGADAPAPAEVADASATEKSVTHAAGATAAVAVSFDDYKREMGELAAPLPTTAAVSRFRHASVPREASKLNHSKTRSRVEDDRVAETLRSVDPNDVQFYQARSVVREYIRRPPLKSTPSSTAVVSRSASSQDHTGKSKPNVVTRRARSAHQSVERPRDRSSLAKSTSARSPSQLSRVGARNTKSSSSVVLGQSGNTADPQVSPREDATRWTRAALLRHEAAIRTLASLDAREGRPRAKSARRTSSSTPDSKEKPGASRHTSPHHWAPRDRPQVLSSLGDSSVSPGHSARELFLRPQQQQQRSPWRPMVSSQAAEPVVALRWQEPVRYSRFQPAIQYGSRRPVRSPRRTEGNASRVFADEPNTWRTRASEGDAAARLERISVSPPTPSPPGTRERRQTDSWQRSGESAQHSTGTAAVTASVPSVQLRSKLDDREGDTTASTWAVPAPSLTRPDLFQGRESYTPRGQPWGGLDEVTPQPRAVQPHPRPVWFREERVASDA